MKGGKDTNQPARADEETEITVFIFQTRKLKFREIQVNVTQLVNELRFNSRHFQLLQPVQPA